MQRSKQFSYALSIETDCNLNECMRRRTIVKPVHRQQQAKRNGHVQVDQEALGGFGILRRFEGASHSHKDGAAARRSKHAGKLKGFTEFSRGRARLIGRLNSVVTKEVRKFEGLLDKSEVVGRGRLTCRATQSRLAFVSRQLLDEPGNLDRSERMWFLPPNPELSS